jgi:tetratricopeptide (TPR) repeat protein
MRASRISYILFISMEEQYLDRIKDPVVVAVLVIIAAALAFLLIKGNSYLKEAEEVARLNNSGDYSVAQDLLLEKISGDSAPELKLMLANSYLDEGSVRGLEANASKKAQAVLFEVEKSYESTYLYDLLGYSYEIINNFEKALEYYNKSLSLDKGSANTLFSIGHTYWLKGETDKARDYYNQAEQAITRSTDNSVKVKIYAGIAVLSKDLAKAEEYFLKTIPLSDSKAFKAEMYSDLAVLKLSQGNSDQAFEYAKMALNTDPSSEMAHLNFAKSAMSKKEILEANWEKVRESLFKAIMLAPRKAEAQYWQGKFEFIGGNHDLALKSYQTALSFLVVDNSLNDAGRTVLKADIFLDEALIYSLKNDVIYKSYIREAYKLNPAKIFYIVDNDPTLKKLRTALIEGNLFLMAKFKPS